MEFVKGASFSEWCAWPFSRKVKSAASACGAALAWFVFVAVFSFVSVYSTKWVTSWWERRSNERLFAELVGKQVQRHVDASTVTHQPYRYVFDKCLDLWEVHRADGSTSIGCNGNVRVLAGDDVMLGRGNTGVLKTKDGKEIGRAVFFGEWRDTFDVADLRE